MFCVWAYIWYFFLLVTHVLCQMLSGFVWSIGGGGGGGGGGGVSGLIQVCKIRHCD